MMTLILHPSTTRQLDAFISNPSHALIINGPKSSGKGSIALNLTERLLGKPAYNHPGVMSITKDKDASSISIDAIRKLNSFLSLKVASKRSPNRVAIIEDADLMTLEAQNALLKTLEEPPAGTVLILSVSNPQALLPTLKSRAASMTLTRPDKQSIKKTVENIDDEAFEQAYAVSGGLPGLMMGLLGEDEHPLKEATVTARTLLTSTVYERLVLIDQLSKNKAATTDTLNLLMQMADRGLQLAKDNQGISKWRKVLKASYKAQDALKSNAQPKLVLTDLALNL
jgi:DNA polymerase-3 subunit delta'